MWTKRCVGLVLLVSALALRCGARVRERRRTATTATPAPTTSATARLGCVYAQVSNPCNDGNSCSTSDVCNGGTCVGGAAASGCTSCQAIATIPADGGTFVGVDERHRLADGILRLDRPSPERVYRWTPTTSGKPSSRPAATARSTTASCTSTARTCGGAELACNDDTAGCTTGEPNDHHGSRVDARR